MTTVTVNVPAAVVAPRGAALAASLYYTIASGFSLWRQSRQARQARSVAAGRAAEAAALRAYAAQIMKQDRRYAADLFAAADRHEMG